MAPSMKSASSVLHTGQGLRCLRVRSGRAEQSVGASPAYLVSRHALQNRWQQGVHTGVVSTVLQMLQWHLERALRTCNIKRLVIACGCSKVPHGRAALMLCKVDTLLKMFAFRKAQQPVDA